MKNQKRKSSAIKIIVNGAQGKMGAMACQTLAKHPEFEVVAKLTRGDDLCHTIKATKADVVLELTRADCVYENTLHIIENGAHPVIGSSGLLETHIKLFADLCQKKHLGGLIVPNFSIAACLMMRFAAEAAHFFPDVEIIEAHHPQKLDAPSGTALRTAEMIARARCVAKNELVLKELVPGARGADYHQVNIHSVRLPGVLAEQQVLFGHLGETLSISHKSMDRASFMPGVVLACQKVMSLDSLYCGLEHLLSM